MPTGYSGKSLVEKLGIRPGDVLAIIDAPDNYDETLGKLPAEVRMVRQPRAEVDIIQIFARSKAGLKRELARSMGNVKQDGMLWVSWRKKSSKIKTDLSDNVVREAGLENGLVDVKVCAIDESWSALKFVRRARDRRASSIGA